MRRMMVVLAVAMLSTSAHADWYKGVTHVHSLWSDGDMAPEMIARWYKERGYQFMSFSEHNRLQEGAKWVRIGGRSPLQPEHVTDIKDVFGNDWVTTRSRGSLPPEMRLHTHVELSERFEEAGVFLMIPAEEISSSWSKVHSNVLNVRDVIPGGEGGKSEVLQRHIDAVKSQRETYGVPMILHLNHVNWSDGVTSEEVLATEGLRFFEVYNGHPGTHPWGRAKDGMPSGDEHWDIMQSMRLRRDPDTPLLYGMATDDSHNYHHWGLGRVNPGRGWIMVEAEALTAEALLSAMEAGHFYSTTGVTVETIEKTEEALRVRIDAEEGVTYRTQFIGTRKNFDASSEPRLGPDGQPLPRATRAYSSDVGEVLFETTENPAVYAFTGDELYVRARVFSDKLQNNPVSKGDYETAWIQPVKP